MTVSSANNITTMNNKDQQFPNNDSTPTGATKEKLRSIMEAASALTALGDEESSEKPPEQKTPAEEEPKQKEEESANTNNKAADDNEKALKDEDAWDNAKRRFLPEHKKADAALTFPEKMMDMMKYADEMSKKDKDFCISWLPEGKQFVITNPDAFTRQVVPKFFKSTKFSSFTRKLYRWGFRQVNRGIGPDDPIIFGNDYFVRDNEELMSQMRSVTAAGTRKQEMQRHMTAYGSSGNKRPYDGSMMYGVGGGVIDPADHQHKRIMFENMMHRKAAANMMHQQGNNSFYGGMGANNHPGGTMSLSSAMRPGLSPEGSQSYQSPVLRQPGHMTSNHQYHHNNEPYDMMQQQQQQHMQQQGQMMNQYNMQQHQQQQHQGNTMQGHQGMQNNQSTAQIVNAAIAALRYAN